MKTKFFLILLKALVEMLVCSMKEMEHGSCDADGVPLDDDYESQSFCLSTLRSLIKTIENKE